MIAEAALDTGPAPSRSALGLVGLCAFMWALCSGRFEDLDGAAERILFDGDDDDPPSSRR